MKSLFFSIYFLKILTELHIEKEKRSRQPHANTFEIFDLSTEQMSFDYREGEQQPTFKQNKR